jgi:hypothetical protein
MDFINGQKLLIMRATGLKLKLREYENFGMQKVTFILVCSKKTKQVDLEFKLI